MENYSISLFRLFFPERCAACGAELPQGAWLMCPRCKYDMPLTAYASTHKNPVFKKFGGLLPLEEASSLIFFTARSRYRSMIHDFKYRGQWRISQELGFMMGQALKESGRYDEVDVVIPIPLHARRRLKRGYNQSEYLARGVAKALGIRVDTHTLRRRTHNPSQATTSSRQERWKNVEDIFAPRDTKHLNGHHILLVDDVLTTGATLISAAESLLQATPTCRISIATLAVSARDLFHRKVYDGV